jgi:hypothetical protein
MRQVKNFKIFDVHRGMHNIFFLKANSLSHQMRQTGLEFKIILSPGRVHWGCVHTITCKFLTLIGACNGPEMPT